MSSYAVEPGARVLWCLRRTHSDIRCLLFLHAKPVEVRVMQDRDLVLREQFIDEAAALGWAGEYEAQLRRHGWRDSPQDCSPSSAA